MPVEAGLRLRLLAIPNRASDHIPSEVCETCHQEMLRASSKGAVLRAEMAAKEQNRLQLWQTRIALIKKAKQLLDANNPSEAALQYEKYLRVLEIVYEKKAGLLTPDLFRNNARRSELTLISAVYWDLLRIYDASARYKDRQIAAAEKLAEFARYSPAFPSIIRKAEKFYKRARNPEAFAKFLMASHKLRPRCFIATAAFDYRNETVETLCAFRDSFLRERAWGRRLILVYYAYSPGIADWLDDHPSLKPATRRVLRWAASFLGQTLDLNHPTDL